MHAHYPSRCPLTAAEAREAIDYARRACLAAHEPNGSPPTVAETVSVGGGLWPRSDSRYRLEATPAC